MRDVELNMYICPNCHQSQLYPHFMKKYEREWNKCTSCGYMELRKHTRYRVLRTLAPEQVPESFVDPFSPITEEPTDVTGSSKSVQEDDKAGS